MTALKEQFRSELKRDIEGLKDVEKIHFVETRKTGRYETTQI